MQSAGVELMAIILAAVAGGITAFVSFRLWRRIHTLRRPADGWLPAGHEGPAARGPETRPEAGRKA